MKRLSNQILKQAPRCKSPCTLSWQAKTQQWTYEFWEGDRLTPGLLNLANTVLPNHFFRPLVFKSNSNAHEQVAQEAGVVFVAQRDLIKQPAYLPLNEGRAQGV